MAKAKRELIWVWLDDPALIWDSPDRAVGLPRGNY